MRDIPMPVRTAEKEGPIHSRLRTLSQKLELWQSLPYPEPSKLHKWYHQRKKQCQDQRFPHFVVYVLCRESVGTSEGYYVMDSRNPAQSLS